MNINKRNYIYLFIVPLFFNLLLSSCEEEKKQVEKYPYESVEDDPLQTRIYKLENGLTVYLSLNRDEPRIQTNIAVRAGSKYDPAETSGLAHYLEHMLFKGNSRIASLNWTEEKKILEQISDLYEKHRLTDDPVVKEDIYARIDSLSQTAAQYVASNEYDKMISSLGAKGTNAYTSNERTVYVNDIPTVELQKWLELESVRFSELTLRLFHTELEAVYEEFNRSQDSDYRKQYYAMLELLFPNHQYGTQHTIGTGEHLKNPSMVKIHEYFNTYYVPNNMAIALAGDLDYDKTIELIDKYFGDWQPRQLPTYVPPREEPIKNILSKEVYGPNTERVNVGFRFGGVDTEDAKYLKLIDGILSNGKAGLLDINLIQKQELIKASSYASIMKDYSFLYLSATPKDGQTLEEARDLLLAQVEMIKKGKFEDWLPEAVVNNFKLQETRFADYNSFRAYMLVNAFILEQDWENYINLNDKLETFSKKQIVEFANKNFGENYAVVYKRTGEDTTIYKVEKPKITPVDINRDTQSVFAQHFDSLPEERLEPMFLDYEKDIQQSELKPGLRFYSVENETNDLFSMRYIFEMGKNHDLELALAINYLPFIGTSELTAEELTKEFFKIGIDYSVYTSDDRIYVTLSGLQENMDPGLALFEGLLNDPKPDQEALDKLIENKVKERNDQKKDKNSIHRQAMYSYGKHGSTNPFNNILDHQEMKAINAEKLTERIKHLSDYEHIVFFYGSLEDDEVKELINKHHAVPEKFTPYPKEKPFEEKDNEKPLVYYVNYDMVQTELMMISKSVTFNKDILSNASIFNEYFGSGLSSIIFQEIRESKALAYAAYAYFDTPDEMDESFYLNAYVGTQTNKLGQATEAILELLNNMPMAEDQFEDSRLAALKKIETDRITRESIFWNYFRNKQLGIDYDIRKDRYQALQKMTIQDLKSFFDKHVKGKNYTFLVIGKKGEVDMVALEKLGEVRELTLEEIFGF